MGTRVQSKAFPARIALVTGILLAPAIPARAQVVGGDLGDLARIQDGVRSRRISSYDRSGGNNDRFEDIPDGARRTLFEVAGAGIVNHIWITIAPPPPGVSRNDIILRMYWDGSAEPCVESPIGPFFGQGWDESYNFSSLPLAAGPRQGRGLVSYFAMPFASGARIEVENDTGREIDAFYYYVDYVALDALPPDLGRFHAWYNHELTEALPDGENEWSLLGAQGRNDTGDGNYLIADTTGQGHFVGVNYYVHSPGPMWYGEGDDMIFIDGEAWPPSLHGTGTEDYFNTSWSPKEPFSHPYYGYGRLNDDVGWMGRTHVYRFHVADPIHFDRSLRFTIEHGHDNALTLDLASVAYWYQRDPHQAFPPLPDRAARAPRPMIGPVEIHRWRDEWRKSHGSSPTLWGDEPAPPRPGSYAADLAVLREHTDVLELVSPDGRGRVAVVPQMQGRVLTSTLSGTGGRSLGWVNRELIASGEVLEHMNPFGGEDRFWVGPEGGQFSVFFAPGDPFDLEHWQTPAAIDTEPWELVGSDDQSVRFRHRMELENRSGTRLDVEVERQIRILGRDEVGASLGLELDPSLRLVAFASENAIRNAGDAPWSRETGLLSIWILGMFPASPQTTAVVPFRAGAEARLGPIVNDAYFGEVPADRLVTGDGVLYFRGDARHRSKIGVGPDRALPLLGSYDAAHGLLTLVQFDAPEAGHPGYVNSMWEMQEDPYGGDVVNSYNDGPSESGGQLGAFYELETSSPAAELAPGESLSHTHRTFHVVGPEPALDALARRTLGVSLDRIRRALPATVP